MIDISAFIERIDAYVVASGRPPKHVSADIFGDNRTLARLKDGHSVTVSKFNAAAKRLRELEETLPKRRRVRRAVA